jgi:hypothetical protein
VTRRRWRTSDSDNRRCFSTIDAAVPPDLAVQLVLDHASTHTTALIRRWLLERTRYHVHCTPISA